MIGRSTTSALASAVCLTANANQAYRSQSHSEDRYRKFANHGISLRLRSVVNGIVAQSTSKTFDNNFGR